MTRTAPAADCELPGPLPAGDTWVALSRETLPCGVAQWTGRPDCGAVVTFEGTVRDHAEGRPGVVSLSYEAYEHLAVERLHAVAAGARRRWPVVRRLALLHRVGDLKVGDVAVVVSVSAPHRDAAFEAARWCIDMIKETVPIWKHEEWAHGSGWGTGAQPLRSIDDALDVVQ